MELVQQRDLPLGRINISKHIIWPVLLVATSTTAISTPAFAQEQEQEREQKKAKAKSSASSWRLSTGVNFSTGRYKELSDTKVISAPVSLKFTNADFRIRVSIPYVHVDGPGSLIQTPEGSGGGYSGGRTDNGAAGSANSGSGGSGYGDVEVDDNDDVPASSTRSGFGDAVVAATYSFDLGSNFFIDASGKVKIPTASTAKRLGTGEVDVTTAADFVKMVGPTTFYVHGRRKFRGKPAGSSIRSVWGAGAGASIRAGQGITVGADYDWQQSSLIGNQASSDVTGWASFRLTRKISLSSFASTGLNSNSADFAGGLSISVKLN